MEEMKETPKRIDIKVKTLPFSLRKFIGEIMSDEAKFNAFAESPIAALVKAGVPIDAAKFTREDAEHLVLVMGKIHAYVKLNKFAKDVKFEQVFNVYQERLGVNAYVSPESYSYTWVHITPDTVTRTHANRGISPHFERDGLHLERYENILTSPLISPQEINAAIAPLEVMVDAELGMG
ncbi:MAG: hypothetical protein PHW87_07010 [Methanothrix sp.]|nr:hypothetical protein [Methanothrix sp.]